MLISDVYNLSV